jgi:phosphoribosylanthranilate isomerase
LSPGVFDGILWAMPVQVKICGITNLEDARVALEAGADALGFVFHERSPRCVSRDMAAEIISGLPPETMTIGVFVDVPAEEVLAIAKACGLRGLQFHGNETPGYCASFDGRWQLMKAFQIRDERSLERLAEYQTRHWLLDAWSPSQPGGIGQTFDWELAVRARRLGRPIFLAGGLTAENVGEAIEKVQPHGVDVSSGVEARPGKKDHEKVRAFVRAAKAAKLEG